MSTQVINGVQVEFGTSWLGAQSITIPVQQLANGQRLPRLQVKIREQSKLFTSNADIRLLTQFLSSRTIGIGGTLTDTAIFLNDAYDRGLTGAIDFTDLRNPKAAGKLDFWDFGTSTIANVPFLNDFTLKIDVPALQEAATSRYLQIDSWQRYLSQGNPSTLIRSGVAFAQNITSANLALARQNTLIDVLAAIIHHEGGGHGIRPRAVCDHTGSYPACLK